MNNDILIIIYRDNYEDMFRAMNELMNYLVDLKDSMSIDKRRATIDICGHIRVTFRCGDVYKMAGLRPNYYETWSWEADKFLAPSAANKAFGFSDAEKEKKKSLSSPARYGMSLKKFRRESFIKQYSYRPIARKHLPYQRRNY